MANMRFDNVKITGVACAVPDFIQKINTDPENPAFAYNMNFVKQTGIRQRHISITEQTGVDLGYAAIKSALRMSGWEPASLDGLFFLTQTPDFNMATGNAFLLHKHLGLPESAFVFDIAQGCAALPHGLSLAAAYLQQPAINRVAIVMGDVMWPMYPDKNGLMSASTFLTGDGVGAMLLEKRADSPPMDIELYSDGSGYHFLYDPWGGVRNAWRHTPGRLPNGEVYMGGPYMDGLEITSFATMRVVDHIKAFLAKNNLSITNFDSVILHQANLQILKAMRRRLKVEESKFPISVDKFANTNGASVLLTLVDSLAGQTGAARLLISAFGIGLSWGIASICLDREIIAPMQHTAHRFDDDFLAPAESA